MSDSVDSSSSLNLINRLDSARSSWNRLRDKATEKNSKVKDISKQAAKFYDDLETMSAWLALSADKVTSLPGISLERKTAARQLEEAQSLQAELVRKGRDCEQLKVDGEALKGTSEVDVELVDRQIAVVEEKWEKISNAVNERVKRLGDVEQKLEDFADALTDVNGSLEKVREKLSAHLALGSSANDGQHLEKIQGLVESVNAIEPQITYLKEMIDRFAGEGVSNSQITDLISSHSDALHAFDDLKESLADIKSRIETTSNNLGDFQNQVKQVALEIQELEAELKGVAPPGRDIDSVSNQISDLRTFQQKMELFGGNVEQLESNYVDLINVEDAKKQIQLLRQRLATLVDATKERDDVLTLALKDLESFHALVDELTSDMKMVTQSDILNPRRQVKDNLEAVKQEQDSFQSFQKESVDPLLKQYEDAKKLGQQLVRSAATNVKTTDLESDLDRLDSTWSALNEKLGNHERKLNLALLKSGKFKEALESLMSWLTDTEELMANQALSSFDSKVIRSQVQMQKMIQRMLDERSENVESIKSTARDIIAEADATEKQAVSRQLEDLVTRWLAVNKTAAEQMQLLESSLVASKDYQDKVAPYAEWLESAEKKLAGVEPIGTNTGAIQKQIEEQRKLNAEITSHKSQLDEVVLSGAELKKHFGAEDVSRLDKILVDLKTRYADLASSSVDRLTKMEEALPLTQRFQDTHEKLLTWLRKMEPEMHGKEPTGPEAEKQLQKLQELCAEFKPMMESLNETGSQLSGLASGLSAAAVSDIVADDNKKFDAVNEQLQKRADRIRTQRQKSMEILGEIDGLIEFFSETERQIVESDCVDSTPEKLREQLSEHKALHDEIIGQKSRSRDVLSAAKRLCRESTIEEDPIIKDKLDDLRQQADNCAKQSNDRLNVIEQALPLAVDFHETMSELTGWLDEMEEKVEEQEPPAITAEQIREQQDKVKLLKQSITDEKPLVDRLNKTGSVLVKLVGEDESEKIHEILENVATRFDALKNDVRERTNTLDDVLLQTSQFSDKLENLLECLETVAEQVTKVEPISAYPDKLSEQIADNRAIIEDMDKKLAAINMMKTNAEELMSQSDAMDGNSDDLKEKIFHMLDTYETIKQTTLDRNRVLEDTYRASEKFWDNFNTLSGTIKEIHESLTDQELPGFEPKTIKDQQETLETLKEELDVAHVECDNLHEAGEELVGLIGEPDKPEVERNVEDVDASLHDISDSWMNRQKLLDEALQKATTFQDELMKMLVWIQTMEDRLDGMGIIPAETNALQQQIANLKDLTDDVLPRHMDIQALNSAAIEMTKNNTSEQAAVIKDPVHDINRRWDTLNENIATRMGKLQKALISLGHFHAVMNEQLEWLDVVNRQLDEATPVYGDPQLIETELAKLKIIKIDMRNHQPSIDSVLDAGREVLVSEGGADARQTRERLEELNRKREAVLTKTRDRHMLLDDALRDAKSFHGELQDLLQQLSEIDAHLATAQPVGGLPETAKKQLDEFTDLEKVLDLLEPKVKFLLVNGDVMLERTPEVATERLKQNLQNVRSRWTNIQKSASDRKTKLVEAVKQSEKFQDELTQAINWVTGIEKNLGNLKPVSRVLRTVREQIKDHEGLLKDISKQKEVMSQLVKMGTHLKYFSQKQDVVLIKNLLNSVQHRWEKINMRATERSRHLETGFNQAKAFETECEDLLAWLAENEAVLDADTAIHNDPDTIRVQIQKHKEFQKALGTKQLAYDSVNANGRTMKEKGPKTDHPALQEMLVAVKTKWNGLCGKSVDRQKALEDALLQSGQFKEALQALLEWLYKVEPQLTDNQLVYGDYDTVAGLLEKHKVFQQDLHKRNSTFGMVHKAASDMLERTDEDTAHLQSQLIDLTTKWDKVSSLSQDKGKRLDEALIQAEGFQGKLHDFQDWLMNAENHLRYLGPVADTEQGLTQQLNEHEAFKTDLHEKETLLNDCLQMCSDILRQAHPDAVSTIKHWQVILRARWEDLLNWSRQRENKITSALDDHRASALLLDDLLAWLAGAEQNLNVEDQKPIPEDLATIEQLLEGHQAFEDEVRNRQPEVDRVTKTSRQLPEPSSVTPSSLIRRGLPLRKGKLDAKKAAEPTFRNPRVSLLFTKWRQMWLRAMERRQKLQDALDRQNEIERMKHFNFDHWRDRYLRWMNNNKSRIMDFFRKQDRDHDGKITRQEFIDGILKSSRNANWQRTEFPTTSMEMQAVADIFDRDGDGFIDYKEFVAALKPDRGGEKTKLMTEGERIHYEIKRQAEHCSCTRQFRITKLSEGKYSFGDSQKLRLVRILRSTVMVRVGGGWMALDEFLVKNDPCRAKGRTNVEMREQFTLPEGMSQTMAHFKTRVTGAAQHGQSGSQASSASSASGGGYTSTSSASGTVGRKPGASFSSWRPHHQKSKVSSDAEVRQILSSKPGLVQKIKTHSHTHDQRAGGGSPCLEGGVASRGSSRPSSRGSSRPPSVNDSESEEGGDTADQAAQLTSTIKVAPKFAAPTRTTVTHQTHVVQTKTSTPGRATTTATRLPKPSATTTTTTQSSTKKTTMTSSSSATTSTTPVRPKKPGSSTLHK